MYNKDKKYKFRKEDIEFHPLHSWMVKKYFHHQLSDATMTEMFGNPHEELRDLFKEV